MQMSDCLFCKIVKGEIPSFKVYEDAQTLAILDIAPVNKGHTLVILKEHYVTILDTPEELLMPVIKTIKKVAGALTKYAEGVNITENVNKAGGQMINHLHFHIIPRYLRDGLQLWPSQGGYAKDEVIATLAALRKLINE
ncbi:MAG: HIT family protein [Candidatus Woesearchaeota archaeon]|nr:HIT family protein [Candidatus Woesearchaeota archaeon]